MLILVLAANHVLVQIRQGLKLGNRGQPTPAKPANFTLDTTLLMGALDTRDTKERIETIMRSHGNEPRVFYPFPPQRDPDDRRGQVVVTDHFRRNPAETPEVDVVAIQKRLLRLVRIGDVHRPARMRQPQHEHEQLHHDPADQGLELTEINLSLSPRSMSLRDRDIDRGTDQLPPDLRHRMSDRGLGHRRPVLVHQTLPDPPGRVTLLTPVSYTHLTLPTILRV